MKKAAFAMTFLTALARVLHADSKYVLHASFPDGAAVEIFTETTGSSAIDAGGDMGIGPGAGSQDLVFRRVVDRANKVLFAYNLVASRGGRPDTVMVRILPISAAIEATMLKRGELTPGSHVPTVAGVREFPAVKIGEVVTLDILMNPATGEKIYDVIRPVMGTPQAMSVSPAPTQEMISLKQIAMRVNGQTMSAPASWMIGQAVRIDIPRYGTYVVAAYDPRDASSGQGFAAIAHADGKTLRWTMGPDRVEIISGTNVLTRSGTGVLWVCHDSHYQPDVVGLQSADTVAWLLPKR